MLPLVIWSNAGLTASASSRLQAGLASHHLVLAKDAPAIPDDAHIAFGQPPVVGLLHARHLRWTQLTSAGYTTYDRDDLRAAFTSRGAVLTRSSAVYDEPCADHALAFMLAAARSLPAQLAQQAGARAWTTKPFRERSFLLREQSVVLFGMGSIGARLAARLAPFGARVSGVRRSARGDESIPTLALDDPRLSELLGRADHVVNLLPANDSTRHLFARGRFAQMKPGAFFYNIGRGTTVDQAALIQALTTGHLRGAFLDVTDPEPLPPDHVLWSTPNCHITPHTAGGHHDEEDRLVAHFLANLARFEAGQGLEDVAY
jgi:phosphoglycerate dehydrogenase-like enzyme